MDRARKSLEQRGVDLDDLASMMRFVLDNGGAVTFKAHVYSHDYAVPERPNLAMVLLRFGHRERREGGHPLETLRRMLLAEWELVLIEADQEAAEAHVGEVLR